jgi:hypothetical protein
LPIFAGSAIQTNSISLEAILLSILSSALTYLLITNSRKYKELKRDVADSSLAYKKEMILKTISLSVISGTVIFFVLRSLI